LQLQVLSIVGMTPQERREILSAVSWPFGLGKRGFSK
jgi:hypothetical protein